MIKLPPFISQEESDEYYEHVKIFLNNYDPRYEYEELLRPIFIEISAYSFKPYKLIFENLVGQYFITDCYGLKYISLAPGKRRNLDNLYGWKKIKFELKHGVLHDALLTDIFLREISDYE
jgi:hypothetical protein